MVDETQCFVCSRKTTNPYYVNGVPLCSTCSTQKSAEQEVQYCSRCNASSASSIILYTPYGLLCSSCRGAAVKIEKVNDSVLLRRMVNAAIVAFYRGSRNDEYYEEQSGLPALQTLIHILLIIMLAVLPFFSGNPLLSAAEILLDALLILLLISFVYIRVKIYGEEIRFLYGPFTYRVCKKDIEKVEITSSHNYLAYGIAPSLDKNGLVLKFVRGSLPGILIRKKSGIFRSVFFSTSDPVNLLKNIAKRMG